MTDVAPATVTPDELNQVVAACLELDKQNAGRLREVAAFFERAAGLQDGESAYAIEVSKPGNLRKQLEQSGRARRARVAVVIFDETLHSADAYASSAQSLVSSSVIAARAIALVALRDGAWRVAAIIAAEGAPEPSMLRQIAPMAQVILSGPKAPEFIESTSGPHAITVHDMASDAATGYVVPSDRLLDDRIRQLLLQQYRELLSSGELRDTSVLEGYHAAFASRFSPAALARLDGEDLVEAMHNHSTRQSLVYWLEFKNDDEFPGIFGSIAGGSALKFGLYKRAETHKWAVPGENRSSMEVSLETAVAIARKHRAQLTAACKVLDRVASTDGNAYAECQRELDRVAPDVSDSAWGHKYLSLMFPSKLDDFHVVEYQKYHLLRMLQPSSAVPGRYANAWRYVAIARELGMPLNHLTTVLNRRDGRPRKYWRIGTSDGNGARNQWDTMRDDSVAAIGWPKIGDIGALREHTATREEVRRLLKENYPGDESVVSRKAGEIASFLKLDEGDVVCAADGATILGIGVVRGPYTYMADYSFAHRREVEWQAVGEWQLSTREGLRTTVWPLKEEDSLLQVERILLDPGSSGPTTTVGTQPPSRVRGADLPLAGVARRVEQILDRKGQVVLYGPPGTGKTHHALSSAREIVSRRVFGRPFSELTSNERIVVEGGSSGEIGLVRMTTFHPEFGYEGFIEGYQPALNAGQLTYVRRDGVFKKLCQDAADDRTKRPHILIIDEINRGDVPRIFGELLTLLERDKRGRAVHLPLGGKLFSVPSNVYIIGTMNTADRSIALLDVALRRRFGFVGLMPDYDVLGSATVSGLPLASWLRWVNARVRQAIGGDGRHREIGHGYFWSNGAPVQDPVVLAAILRDDVIPLLEDYFFEDLGKLEQILGDVIVDADEQRIRYDVFDGEPDSAISALLEAAPELGADTASTSLVELDSFDDEGEDEVVTS